MNQFKLSRKVESVLAQASGSESYMLGITFLSVGLILLALAQAHILIQVLSLIASWFNLKVDPTTWLDSTFIILALIFILIGGFFLLWGWLSPRIRTIEVLIVQESYQKISHKTVSDFISKHSDRWIKVKKISRIGLEPTTKGLENYRRKLVIFARRVDMLRTPYYVGIVHIPFAALMGFLTKNQRFNFLEIKHSTKEAILLNSNNSGGSFNFITQTMNPNVNATEVSVVVSVSHKIDVQEVTRKLNHPLLILDANQIKEFPYSSQNELSDAATKMRSSVLGLKTIYPKLSHIHLFYAGPASLIITFSQMINPNIDPTHTVYNFERNSGYVWGIELNNEGGKIVRLP
jgi:hypothetical protein